MTDEFRSEYARRYGQSSIVLGAPIELVNLRAIGIGRTVRASIDSVHRTGVDDGTPGPQAGSRPVHLGREGESQAVATYETSSLQPGHRIEGPALIDGLDTTIWIPPDTALTVDERSTLTAEVLR
jgi:N-methylhydantoinase A